MTDETVGSSVDEHQEQQEDASPVTEGQRERTFTQADVDRIVAQRLTRAKAEPPQDYEDLKAKAARLDELEEQSKSELEREREARAKAEARAAQMEAEARETRLLSAVLTEAAKADRKVVDPEAVLALLDRSELELDEAGLPTNTASVVDSLLEKRPYLVASSEAGTRAGADQGARAGGKKQLTRAQLQSMSPEEIVAARREGRLDSVLSGAA